jgi:hypothetical protein
MRIALRKVSTTVKTEKFKVTALAVYRGLLKEERYSRAQAKACKRQKEWKDLVPAYIADADEYKELAALVKAEKWKEAYKFYSELDTFVREGVPTHHVAFIARKVIAEHERKRK